MIIFNSTMTALRITPLLPTFEGPLDPQMCLRSAPANAL